MPLFVEQRVSELFATSCVRRFHSLSSGQNRSGGRSVHYGGAPIRENKYFPLGHWGRCRCAGADARRASARCPRGAAGGPPCAGCVTRI
jgi:hypothetical protein